ncbi:hypothetical protein, partial [Phaeobacter italicus]|uniref:hypothetical protein n=1 Tax=Phaeobacter italicus TaxID=481446 RepID=UPI002FDDA6AE
MNAPCLIVHSFIVTISRYFTAGGVDTDCGSEFRELVNEVYMVHLWHQTSHPAAPSQRAEWKGELTRLQPV